MNKSDLKDGMVLETKDGNLALIIKNKLLFKDSWSKIENFDNNLNSKFINTCDIKSVYEIIENNCMNINDIFCKSNLKLIWEREKEIDWDSVPVEIDWDNVAVGIKVLVRDFAYEPWEEKMFVAKLKGELNRVYSFRVIDEATRGIEYRKYCKLKEE